jgi:hypothetical protein
VDESVVLQRVLNVSGIAEAKVHWRDVVRFTLSKAMKAQMGSRSIALLFLYLRRHMGVGVNATPQPLYPRGKRPGTHCTGGRVGPRAGLERCGNSRPHRDSILRPSSP